MAAFGDIEKLVKIGHEHKLNFLRSVFEECSNLLTKIDIDSSKNNLVCNKKILQSDDGWTNHRLFGSRLDNKIHERNLLSPIPLDHNNVSIFSSKHHPFLERKVFPLE